MLRIRKEHLAAIEETLRRNFEDEMVAHVKLFFSNHHSVMGPDLIRTAIQHGIRRALSHGLTTQRSVCLYINAMFMLGGNFDLDIQLPWAQKILHTARSLPESRRADALTEGCISYIDYVAGLNNIYLYRALSKIRDELSRIRSCSVAPYDGSEVLRNALLGRLQQLFSRKYYASGPACMETMVRYCERSAIANHLTTIRGVTLYVTIAFILGSALESDPLASWVDTALSDHSTPDEPTAFQRLLKESERQLDAWLSRAKY